jgi:nucleoside-diphosphate kinase
VKPDAVAAGHTGAIVQMIEQDGFTIRALRMTRLSAQQARAFYAVHAERPFYDSLVEFMVSAPVVVAALERTGAVAAWRRLMGATNPAEAQEGTVRATNPAEAQEGTVRARFGSSIERNSTHGSDSTENAAAEVGFFFSAADLL